MMAVSVSVRAGLSLMTWNWEKPDLDQVSLAAQQACSFGKEFLIGRGMLAGSLKNLSDEEQAQLTVGSMTTEAVTTSEIEGEVLDRGGVQSSIHKSLA